AERGCQRESLRPQLWRLQEPLDRGEISGVAECGGEYVRGELCLARSGGGGTYDVERTGNAGPCSGEQRRFANAGIVVAHRGCIPFWFDGNREVRNDPPAGAPRA